MPEYIIHCKKRKTHLNSRIAVIIGKRKLLRAKNGDVSRKKWSLRKKLLLIFAVMFLLGGGFYAASNLWIAAYSDSVYDEIPRLPETYTAVVLGCSPFIGSTGRQNLYFRYRMNAAAMLYHSGRIKTLLLSGDNGRKGYNEPEAMRQYLLTLGVPDSALYCDYAGFSTLDSMIRAEAIFGQKKFIVISQRFHCERAVFLARCKGLEAYGFAAENVESPLWKYRSLFRESLARPAAILDLITMRDARFGGEKVDMTAPQMRAL
ncbi:MAG: hypothetical protein E7058_06405 [Lentisphaerae bacterium]|nr:hypothetical protein [Lentisphaerota bacterium]